jgi:hypothetical protein
MKRIIAVLVAGTLSLGGAAIVGVTSASAAQTTPTIKLTDPKAVFGLGAYTITATASVAGNVNFTAGSSATNGTSISGCGSVATTTATPFLATCSWTPTATSSTTAPIYLSATLTPTDSTDYSTATATPIAEVVAAPVQGTQGPIFLYTDTILASGSKGVLAPSNGIGCEEQNEFIVGQTIVFRVYGNDADLGGVALTPQNVASAVVEIGSTTLTMSFGNHGAGANGSGIAFWTAALATGTGTGQYDTLGVIPYQVIVKTNAVPAVTKTVPAVKYVVTKKHGKVVKVGGSVVYHAVKYQKTVIVTPAVPGATGTFSSNFNALSVATLNAVPAS